MLIVYKYTMRMNPKNITMMMMTLMQLFQAKRISHVFVKIDKKWNTQQILQKGLEDRRRVVAVLTFKMDQITCVSYSNQTENSMTHSYVGDCISCFFVVRVANVSLLAHCSSFCGLQMECINQTRATKNIWQRRMKYSLGVVLLSFGKQRIFFH